jgi:hypothetical protein
MRENQRIGNARLGADCLKAQAFPYREFASRIKVLLPSKRTPNTRSQKRSWPKPGGGIYQHCMRRISKHYRAVGRRHA